MSAYVLSEDANLDLDEIWEYIARDNIDAADRWIVKLFDAFEAIGRTPGIGHNLRLKKRNVSRALCHSEDFHRWTDGAINDKVSTQCEE